MRYILSLIVFILLINTGQSQILLLMDSDSATTLPSGGGGYPTDSLLYYWDYTSLTNGDIIANEWEDETANIPFTTVDGNPTKNDSGVVFDGDDDVVRNVDTLLGGLAVEMVIRMADSSSSHGTWFNADNGSELHVYSLNTSDSFIIVGNNGTTSYTSRYYTTQLHQKFAHIVANFDGSSNPSLFINGVEQTAESNAEGSLGGTAPYIILGYSWDVLSNGNIISLVRFYDRILTTDEIDDCYNDDTVQSKL